jgi:hypothetical protein
LAGAELFLGEALGFVAIQAKIFVFSGLTKCLREG